MATKFSKFIVGVFVLYGAISGSASRADGVLCWSSGDGYFPEPMAYAPSSGGGLIASSGNISALCYPSVMAAPCIDGPIDPTCGPQPEPEPKKVFGCLMLQARSTYLSGSGLLTYQLYRDYAATVPFDYTENGMSKAQTTVSEEVSGLLNFGSIYLKIPSGQWVNPTGVYYSDYLEYKIKYGAYPMSTTTAPNCEDLPEIANQSVGLVSLHVKVQPECLIESVTPLNFGSVLGIGQMFIGSAVGNISVKCTAGTSYTIQANSGLHSEGATYFGGSGIINRLRHSSLDEYLDYVLQQDDYGDDSLGQLPLTGIPGVGTGITQQYPIYGKLLPQPASVAGTYTDTVVLTLQY